MHAHVLERKDENRASRRDFTFYGKREKEKLFMLLSGCLNWDKSIKSGLK
jgi:hypothetical protein